MKHLIIDFETMGVDSTTCAVVDCSAFIFDWDRFLTNPYTMSDLNQVKRFKLSVAEQAKNYGYAVEKSVLEFWSQQEKEVRSRVSPKPDDLTLNEFTEQFHKYISTTEIKCWWSRSNTFDPIILERLFAEKGKKQLMANNLKYYAVRDTRTFIDAKLDFPKQNGFIPVSDVEYWEKNFKQHDSSWDVLADVLRMQAIIRAENDMEMITK